MRLVPLKVSNSAQTGSSIFLRERSPSLKEAATLLVGYWKLPYRFVESKLQGLKSFYKCKGIRDVGKLSPDRMKRITPGKRVIDSVSLPVPTDAIFFWLISWFYE